MIYAMFDDKYMDRADSDCEYETFSTNERSSLYAQESSFHLQHKYN